MWKRIRSKAELFVNKDSFINSCDWTYQYAQTKMQACRRLAFGLFLGCAGQWQAKHPESSLLLACPRLSKLLACCLACFGRLNSRPNYRRLVFGLSFALLLHASQIKLTGQKTRVYIIWQNNTLKSRKDMYALFFFILKDNS